MEEKPDTYCVEKTGQISREKRLQRHKKKYKVIVLFLLVVLTLCLIFFLYNRKGAIKGTWIYDQYTQYEFDGKRSGCMCIEALHYEFTYAIKGNRLKIDFSDTSVHDCEYEFMIDNDSLTLIGGEGTVGGTYILKKK